MACDEGLRLLNARLIRCRAWAQNGGPLFFSRSIGSARPEVNQSLPARLPGKAARHVLRPDPRPGGGTAGTAAFEHKDYRGAANYWEKVVQTAPTDSEFACSIGNSLEEARALAEGRQPVVALPEIMPVKPAPMGQATQSSSAER